MTTALRSSTPFDSVLAGRTNHLVRDDGVVVRMDALRWRSRADTHDGRLLDRCTGPVIDLGCGPGRLVAALAARGIPALGVDSSPVARVLCQLRCAPMICRDVFAALPGEGSWAHVLLADGNIGIGGDPVRLLARAAVLLAAGGTVLVETDPEPGEWWCGSLRVPGDTRGRRVPWACVGLDAVRVLAPATGLRVTDVFTSGPRSFAALAPA